MSVPSKVTEICKVHAGQWIALKNFRLDEDKKPICGEVVLTSFNFYDLHTELKRENLHACFVWFCDTKKIVTH